MEVEKISDDAELMAVLSGLWPRTRFWWSVHEDGPWMYHEFIDWAEKHISAEEAMSDQDDTRSDPKPRSLAKEKRLEKFSTWKKDGREGKRPA